MRYFIFYPPSNSIRLIDVSESVLVEDILELVRREFDLKVHGNGPSEASIVLSYNGFDLKPKWSLADFGIPSGAIIRCLYREKQAADLYVHCGFNKQVLKLFDSSITMGKSISTIRKKISDKLGLPLSLFCLETYDGKLRFYDEMKLMSYDIKSHDHVYLKVWQGYERFISSCIRGFAEHYSHDDLIRHYQAQAALYIAAFYGHMDLANSAIQHGARSDHPVGEHPSRQWSSETAFTVLPEMLKCPIHIAIERGHIKMVDLFVRQSVLCTQARDPVTGFLPYKLAMSFAMSSKTKEEKQCFGQIYFYLHDKHYNFKIPINATGEYVSKLLASTTISLSIRRSPTHYLFVSLPLYCRIISWYERARERVWKKFGGRFYSTTQTKRIYPKKGLLGYKVLIDGYNNTFEVPKEQLRGALPSNEADRYVGCSDEEREKIIKMKTYMKQFGSDEKRRWKQIADANRRQSRRSSVLKRQTSTDLNKHPNATTQGMEGILSSSEFSSSQILSVNNLLSSELINPIQTEDSPEPKVKSQRWSKTIKLLTTVNVENKPTVPLIASPIANAPATNSTLPNKSETVTDPNKQVLESIMSSADAYLISSARLGVETKQRRETKRQELFTQIEQLTQQEPEESTTSSSNPINTELPIVAQNLVPDVDSCLHLPDYPSKSRPTRIQSRADLEIRQSTIQPYERHASASIRSTAIHCLQEASHFRGKSWIKQVEISKEMVKNQVQRRIRCSANEAPKKPSLLPLRATVPTTQFNTNTVKVN